MVVARGDDVAARMRDAVPEGVDAVADGSISTPRSCRPSATVVNWPRCGRSSARPSVGIINHMVWVREYQLEQERLDRLGRQVEEER